jgi:CTP-dependent riboflavin kinase
MTIEDRIAQFCIKARTAVDVRQEFRLSEERTARILRQLIREERIVRRNTDQGTERMKTWYVNVEKPPLDLAALATQSSRQVMGVWM